MSSPGAAYSTKPNHLDERTARRIRRRFREAAELLARLGRESDAGFELWLWNRMLADEGLAEIDLRDEKRRRRGFEKVEEDILVELAAPLLREPFEHSAAQERRAARLEMLRGMLGTLSPAERRYVDIASANPRLRSVDIGRSLGWSEVYTRKVAHVVKRKVRAVAGNASS